MFLPHLEYDGHMFFHVAIFRRFPISSLYRELTTISFGATMEEFEVRDAMESVLSQKASPAIAPANMVVSNTARSVRV